MATVMNKEKKFSLSTLNGSALQGNAWKNRRPQSTIPIWKAPSYTRKWDLTFSLGYRVTEYEVLKLLFDAGCIDDNNVKEYIRGIVVGENLFNGHVFVFCTKPELSDIFVEKLMIYADAEEFMIYNCHSYSNSEISVRFSHIHPSIDIENDIVKGHLESYGKVKNWSRVKDPRFGVPTCAVNFIMYEQDLRAHPLPSRIHINQSPCNISYRTQSRLCFKCGSPNHMKRDCPQPAHVVIQTIQL